MRLIERYALSSGLKIKNPYIYPLYFPLATEKYIVVHASNKDNLRDWNLGYWFFTLETLKKYLGEYKIVQIGLKDEPQLPLVDIDLRGQLNVKQTAHIIKKSSLFIGIDSFPAHLAGYFKIPMIALYANSYVNCVMPVWGDKSKQHLIGTHRRKDEKPSFSFHEEPKTIDRIYPEEVIYKALDFLNIEVENEIETIYMGDKYSSTVLECIPDSVVSKQFNPDVLLYIRYDLGGDENIIYSQIHERKSSIITDKPLNVDILKKLKNNIHQIIIDVKDSMLKDFVKQVYFSGINYIMISYLPQDELNKLKINYCDYGPIIKLDKKNSRDYLKDDEFHNKEWSKLVDYSDCFYKTNKYLLSDGKIFLGKYFWRRNQPLQEQKSEYSLYGMEEDFWEDGDFFYVFRRKIMKNGR